jgi:hypothetical protein
MKKEYFAICVNADYTGVTLNTGLIKGKIYQVRKNNFSESIDAKINGQWVIGFFDWRFKEYKYRGEKLNRIL